MIVADGASVTETPRLKRGSMWYASAPFNSPIRGHSTLTPVLGVGAILSACGAPPSTRSERLRARWGYEAGSLALQGGAAHRDPRMTDYIWREAEDKGTPRIWAVSRSYLLSNLDKLNFDSNTDIITFLTLADFGVPIPNVVLAYDKANKTLKVFPLDKLKVVEYDLSTISKIASDHPVQRLVTFLS